MKCSNCDTEYDQEYCPVCDIRFLAEEPAWYYKNWFIAICLLVFFPAGLVLAWRKPGWTVWLKSLLTVVFGLFFIALAFSVQQSMVGLTELYLEVENDKSQSYDTGLTIGTNIEGTPERAWLKGIIYYSDDESIVRFENGKILTIGEGTTSIYVSNSTKTVYSNKISVTVVDKEAEWIELEANRAIEAETIEAYINALGDITVDSGTAITMARETYDNADTEVQQLVTNLAVLEKAESQYELLLTDIQGGASPEGEDLNRTVFYTRTGSKYHYINPCGSGTYYACTLAEALEMGLEPCAKCVN